jgi:competence protein ComEC
MALKFVYGESSAWFSGDLYVTQERALVSRYGEELQSDVAKANHHGGDTSNSLRWIKNLKPGIVVAMHDELDSMTVYKNYLKYGATYHLTLNDGNVKITMDDKKNYSVIDEKDSWMN